MLAAANPMALSAPNIPVAIHNPAPTTAAPAQSMQWTRTVENDVFCTGSNSYVRVCLCNC